MAEWGFIQAKKRPSMKPNSPMLTWMYSAS